MRSKLVKIKRSILVNFILTLSHIKNKPESRPISYKIYTSEFEVIDNKYMKLFTYYNVLGLILMTLVAYLFLVS